MTPEVISTTKCSSCGGDAYCYVCIVPFAKELESLRPQLTTLQQENIMLAAQVEGLRKSLINLWARCERLPVTCPLPWNSVDSFNKLLEESGAAINQTPPPTYTSKVMELALLGIKYKEAWDARKYEVDGTENTVWWQVNMEAHAGALLHAAAAFTPEELTWLGGK